MIREIEPNTITHICCLITGDRFYCWSDVKKKVWQVRYHSKILIRGQFKNFSYCIDDNGEKVRFDANRVIMFLRRTKPIVKKTYQFAIEKYFP